MFLSLLLVRANDSGSATGRLLPARKDGAAANAAAQNGCSRPPMGGGGRMAAHVRPSRRTLCFMRSLGRSDEDGWETSSFLPGRPARRVGPLHAEQRHFSGYSFGAKRVPLRSSSYSRRKARCHLSKMELARTSGTRTLCPCMSCEAKETPTVSASPRKRHPASPRQMHRQASRPP